jgi:hypothetical protein
LEAEPVTSAVSPRNSPMGDMAWALLLAAA